MSASTSIATAAGGMLVVTHVIPAPQGAATQNSAEKRNHRRREQLLALGTVQIMIGVAVFLFELAMIPHTDSLGMYSGAFVWAPLFDILSGSLIVSAGTSVNKCRLNGGVGFSIVAAVASAAATSIYVLDAYYNGTAYNYYYNSYVQLIIMTNQSHEAASQTPATAPTQGALPTYEAPPIPETPPPSESDYETVKPQEYNTEIV
ncbi:uncharacterized protein LOC116058508 isoform X3 [Sander lucioperca]|uniref:uncharacterized protein LOC116058508 isoform X3 n=1 Tax=Sander lucioperca TaxID=283035 RepID=UPI00125E7AB9|nr:uncharacterized protein LOC116058508 isoform X3 [Sander lucioperca]